VGFINPEIAVVLFLDLDDLTELQDLSFHRVDALNNDQNLSPWEMSSGLSLTDRIVDDLVEVFGIVVFEDLRHRFHTSCQREIKRKRDQERRLHAETNLDACAAGSAANNDGGVVQGVTDDEISLSNERRDCGGVCCVSHAEDDGILLANKLCDGPFELSVDVKRSGLDSRRALC